MTILLRGPRTFFRFVDSLVDAFDLILRPFDKGNVIGHTELLPHIPHHPEKYCGVQLELVTHLSVDLSSSQSAQYDRLFACQRWVQPERRSALNAN